MSVVSFMLQTFFGHKKPVPYTTGNPASLVFVVPSYDISSSYLLFPFFHNSRSLSFAVAMLQYLDEYYGNGV